ncbi:hypothetical protein NM688_g6596 [Phlebia brevispora]|uniref:Uncharacterized protein n=1 Tax=Phlebia brevispora TaxID=194682 RepID=A0ACC1SEB6_9APHY|nr:hypothetical protein NM688_g6596 [Phlebia brevispora]
MYAFNHQIGVVNIINGKNHFDGANFQTIDPVALEPLQLGDYGFGQLPAQPSLQRNSIRALPSIQHVRKPSTHQRRPSASVPRWLAEARQSNFSRILVRGQEEFDSLATFLHATSEAPKRVTNVVFEGADRSQTTILTADIFIAVVCPLWSLQSVTLRNLRLGRRVDTQPFTPLGRNVRELCMDAVEPIDVTAVLDVLACVPRLLNLRLSKVGDLQDSKSTTLPGPAFWEVDFLRRLPAPRPQLMDLQGLELRSVCLSKFYLNLARAPFSSQVQGAASKLTTLVAECSQMDDIEALDDLLFYSRSLEHLSVDISGCFRFGIPAVEGELLREVCI